MPKHHSEDGSTGYYSDWRTRTWACACGWTGTGNEAEKGYFDDLLELLCASCGDKLTLVPYPSESETRAAANAGNPEAQRELSRYAALDALQANLAAARQGLERLPDLPGRSLTFTLATVGDDWLSPDWLLLLHDGREIYREPSGFEGWKAILVVGAALKARYGDRVAWLDPGQAGVNLLGDDMSAPGHIETFLAREHLTPPKGRWGPQTPDPGPTGP